VRKCPASMTRPAYPIADRTAGGKEAALFMPSGNMTPKRFWRVPDTDVDSVQPVRGRVVRDHVIVFGRTDPQCEPNNT
jgi:hypothetical protein